MIIGFMGVRRGRGFEAVTIRQVGHCWDARPCNIRHSLKPVGSEEYFNEVKSRKYRVEPHIPAFVEFARWRGKRVREIACGVGTDTMKFAKHGAEVTSIDLPEASLEVTRKRARVYGLEDRIRVCRANAEELKGFVPVEPYDFVYAFGALHDMPQPDRALDKIRRYLPPGGALKIIVCRWSWKVLSILLTYGRRRFWRLDELIAAHSEAQTGCPVTYTYTRRQVRRWLARQGLRVEALRVMHDFPYRIRDYVQCRYTKASYFRWLPRRVFEAPERVLGWHLYVTAIAS